MLRAIQPWRVVLPLALAETLIWAMTFYMFPAMLPTWEAELGWSKTELSLAFTAALVLSALVAPVVGRLIDRRHGRATMAGACLLAALMMALLSIAESRVTFYLAWAGIGVAMGGALYEACFSFVTRLLGAGARRAITAITLVAGFAGTVSFPSTHWLNGWLGWRATLVVYAAVVVLVILPLLAMVPSGRGSDGGAGSTETGGLQRALRRPVFWLLAVGFALIALEHGMVITHLLPLLHDRGFGVAEAVLAASLIGPMQVVGRIAMIVLQRRWPIVAISMLSVSALGAAAIAVGLSASWPALLLPFVVLQGAGNGVTSISRPVLTAECLGHADFGAISGAIAVLFLLMMAAAPSLASLLWEAGGYDLVMVFVFACCAVSFVCLSRVARRQRESGCR